MFISILYEAALTILGICTFPWLVYQWLVKKKYRKSLLKRLGSGFPEIKKGNRALIWIHAVSLGETKAVMPLVKLLRTQLNHPIIIFSNTTETGHVEACRSIPADHHVYLPFDLGWVINPIVKKTAPDLLILCESDFWFNLLRAAKNAGAYIAVVNGKISNRSLERFLKVPLFTKKLFSMIDLFCLQGTVYQKRFESLGVPSEKIITTGNMKLDGDYAPLPTSQLEAWRRELGISAEDPVIVVGSTHHPEEMQLLEVFSHVWKKHPTLKVLLVPRHPERFNEVAGILQKSNINFRRLSH